jgi:hypothetical protein
MPTQVAWCRRRFPSIDLDLIFAEFLRHPLRFEQEISKAQITNLSSPKLLHRFEVQRLEHKQIEYRDQYTSLLPLPIVADIGYLLVDARDIQSRVFPGL